VVLSLYTCGGTDAYLVALLDALDVVDDMDVLDVLVVRDVKANRICCRGFEIPTCISWLGIL